jgi:hypothetical protein
MMISKSFFRFAALCTLITAFTTMVVHAVPNLFSEYDTFVKRVDLRNNSTYMTRFWIVLLHCALVVISMYAVGIRKLKEAPVLILLGFLCFVLFAFTEWLRTTVAIFGLNRNWRSSYANASEEAAKQFWENYINAFGGINDALFFLFFTCFIAGCICYGFAYFTQAGSDRKIALLFFIWAALGIPAWIDEIFLTSAGSYFSWSWYYQSAARAVLGVWLWKTADEWRFSSPKVVLE